MRTRGKVAVVTGAASGMGRSLTMQLAKAGTHVACCDVDATGLEETVREAQRVGGGGVKITGHVVDVADEARVRSFAEEVLAQHDGRVHMLFANAGVSGPGALIHDEKTTPEEVEALERGWERCFNINYLGVLFCVRAFIGHIVRQPEGYVIITSSVNGFWTWPEHGSYTSAKFAVRGLAESLLVETYAKAPHVRVAVVHPGGVRTGIVQNSYGSSDSVQKVNEGFAAVADLDADEAAAWILDGVARDKTRILVGYDAIMLDVANRLGPHASYDVWKALGKEGVSNFTPKSGQDLQAQFRRISPAGWLRVLYGGGLRMLLLFFPTLVARGRRHPAFWPALAAVALVVARKAASRL